MLNALINMSINLIIICNDDNNSRNIINSMSMPLTVMSNDVSDLRNDF